MDKHDILTIAILLFCFILVSIAAIVIPAITSSQAPQKIIPYQTNYWDFYSPFSDIYIKEMLPYGSGSIVYFYPDGNVTFSFVADKTTVRKEVGDHFIECTKAGEYTIITDTDIPFLPKINPFVWGTPVGDNDDFEAMKKLLQMSPPEEACYTQVDSMVILASEQGIIIRRINLWQSPTNGILTAEGHTTIEIYNRKTKQWVWMDPLYNVTEGKIGNKPITLYDLRAAINRGESITLTMTNGKEIQFDQWQYAKNWKNYLNPSQTITYVTPGAYPNS